MEEDSNRTAGFDFEAYRLNTMPVADQHRFEQAMLNDPLLADAYDGYLAQIASNSKQGVPSLELSAMLHERIKPKHKVIPLWYYLAAASVLLLIGLFVGWDSVNRGADVVSVAVVKEEPALLEPGPLVTANGGLKSEPSVPGTPTPKKPTISRVQPASPPDHREEQLSASEIAARRIESRSVGVLEDTVRPRLNVTDALVSATKGAETEQVVPATRAFVKMPSPAAATSGKHIGRIMEGTVSDASGQALPGVMIQSNKGRGAVTDASGHYAIQADSTDSLRFDFVGYKPTTVSAPAAKSIRLEENLMALSEVVVVGYGKAKKSNRSASLPLPGPESGWVAYRQYLKQQARVLGLKEQVVVRFELDDKGRPVNLQTDKQDASAEIAKRIVTDGVRWHAEKRKKNLSVTVPAGQ